MTQFKMKTVELNPCERLISPQPISGDSSYKVTYILYENLKNTSVLRQRLMKGEIEAALINPSMVADLLQVTMAASRALRSKIHMKMSTKSIHAEIIYNLSPSKKIADALMKFGLGAEDSSVLCVVLCDGSEDKMDKLKNQIEGDIIDLENLPSFRNEDKIKKYYKISEEDVFNGSLLHSVLGRMACKEFPVI